MAQLEIITIIPFLGHPNPKNVDVKNYGASDWGNPVPNPVDAFDQENFYYDSMLFLKKVTSNDVRRVVPRLDWQTGTIYEMYRNNYSSTNLTPQTKSTTLYGSNYFVLNSEFNLYLCGLVQIVIFDHLDYLDLIRY